MTLSIVIFAFGLVITGIAGLGVINAQESARRISLAERSAIRHQSAWREMCRKNEQNRMPKSTKAA